MKGKIAYPPGEFWDDYLWMGELIRSPAPEDEAVARAELHFRDKYGAGADGKNRFKHMVFVMDYLGLFSHLFLKETRGGELDYPKEIVESVQKHAAKHRIYKTRDMPPGCYFSRGKN